ncbi:T9SS type A sorting domain-containing protein [Spirosoma rigui]|uniref:T9SS type A sorting domain-containing protein n=1 Tax=Spirosoma rigui TaxID=564064 RepID=UPI0009B14D84|nr:T9SS type A sorting domain-containing protein [Spirosoma rigui]
MKTCILFGLTWLSALAANATHLRGGYIQTRSVSTTTVTYEITVQLFLDEVYGTTAANSLNQLSLCFGDGSSQSIVRTARVWNADRTTSINTYQVTHTYAGPGTYTVSSSLANRSPVRNIGTTADQLPIVLYTTFSTGRLNRTPAFVYPNNGLQAALNQRLTLPLSTTDDEGDSLVYSLWRPITTVGADICTRQSVSDYQYPNDVARRGTYTLDKRRGILTWDAPVEQGNYSLALTVDEYRNGLFISQTVIELTLQVVDRPGTPGVIPPYQPALESNGLVTALPEYRDSNLTLTVFPNPVDDRLQVVVQTSNPTLATIRLMDASGRLLHELPFKRLARRHEQVISLDSLTPGTYLVQTDVNGQQLLEKIIKK